MIPDPRMGNYPPRVRRDLGVGPRGNSRRALASLAPAYQQSPSTLWGWGFHTLRGGIDPGDLRFLPRLVGVVDLWKDL